MLVNKRQNPKIDFQSILVGATKFSIVPVLSAILGVVILPIVTRLYSPDEYGRIILFFSMGMILQGVSLCGLDSAYIRFFYKGINNLNSKSIFKIALFCGLLVNLLFALCIMLFVLSTGSFFDLRVENISDLIVLYFYSSSLIIFRMITITYRMEGKAYLFNIQNGIQLLSQKVLIIFTAFWSASYFVASRVVTIFLGIISCCSLIMLNQETKSAKINFDKSSIKELFKYALPLMPTAVIVILNNSVGIIVLSHFNKYEELGIVSIAISVANSFSIISSGFGLYWSSFMYKYYKTQQNLIIKTHNYVLIICVFIVSFIILGQDIIYLLLGGKYKLSQPFFMLLMLGPICAFIGETTGYGINIAKRTKYLLYIMSGCFVLNVFLSILLVPKFGSLGISISIAVVAIIGLVSKSIVGQKYYKSIESKSKSISTICILISLCSLNYFYYNKISIRLFLSGSSICVVCLLFKQSIYNLKNKICLFLKSIYN